MSAMGVPGDGYIWYPCQSELAFQTAKDWYRRELEYDSEYPKYNKSIRYKLIGKLTSLGCEVQDNIDGLLVNNKFVVAINTNKWRVNNKWTWYRYSTVETLVEKYINKDTLYE